MGQDDKPEGIVLVYCAGNYTSAPDGSPAKPYQRHMNIARAWETGLKVASYGAMPIVPHLNTGHMDGIEVRGQADETKFWIEGTLELMRRCDAVLLIGEGWPYSAGTCGEIREAVRLKMPVFVQPFQLRSWLEWGRLPKKDYYDQLLKELQR